MAYWDTTRSPLRGQRERARLHRSVNALPQFVTLRPRHQSGLVPVSVYLDCILSNLHWCSVNRMCGRCGSILHCSIYADSKSTFRPLFVSSFTTLVKGGNISLFLCFILRALTRRALFLFIVCLNFWFHCISGFICCVPYLVFL